MHESICVPEWNCVSIMELEFHYFFYFKFYNSIFPEFPDIWNLVIFEVQNCVISRILLLLLWNYVLPNSLISIMDFLFAIMVMEFLYPKIKP